MIEAAENAINELRRIDREGRGDPECAHIDAEGVLLQFIRDIGYPEVADAYNDVYTNVGFWYA